MPTVNPYQVPGQWYRGNTHCHSTVSDGKRSLAERCEDYRHAGYAFLVATDHHRVSDVAHLQADGFLVISGSELHPANPFNGELYHLVALDIHEEIDVQGQSAYEVITAVKQQGGEVIICHPYWCGNTIVELLPLQGCIAVEVYNDTCACIGKANAEQTWDELLDKSGLIYGIASDDCHRVDDCFHAWIMVKAPELSLTAIMDALRSGCYYSTCGPEIHDIAFTEEIVIDANGVSHAVKKVKVTSSPARSIIFKGAHFQGSHVKAPANETITHAEYILPETKYVRVEIVDADGHTAWSNPFFLE